MTTPSESGRWWSRPIATAVTTVLVILVLASSNSRGLVSAVGSGSGSGTRSGSTQRTAIRVSVDESDSTPPATANAVFEPIEFVEVEETGGPEFDPSLNTEEAPSGDDGLPEVDLSIPLDGEHESVEDAPHPEPAVKPRPKPNREPEVTPAPLTHPLSGPEHKPTQRVKALRVSRDDEPGKDADPNPNAIKPLTEQSRVIYSTAESGRNSTDRLKYAHSIVPTGPNVNVTTEVHRHANGSVTTIITAQNETIWTRNTTTVTVQFEHPCPILPPIDYPTFCCYADPHPTRSGWEEERARRNGGFCVYCPLNCTCGDVCGECLCPEEFDDYDLDNTTPVPLPPHRKRKPHATVTHVKKPKRKPKRKRIPVIERVAERKEHKKRARKKDVKYVEKERKYPPVRKLITPWGPHDDKYYTYHYQPQQPWRSPINKPGCKPIYAPINAGLVYPTVTLTPKKLDYEGPITVSGVTVQSLIHTGRSLSFWLSPLCMDEGTEKIPKIPGYMITQPLIQVRAIDGTPGVGPQQMSGFGAKAPVMLGGEMIGIQYFGAVFKAENVFGEGEQFIHDGTFGLGALIDMPIHIPIIGHKAAMQAFKETLILKGLLPDKAMLPKERKVCDDAQKGIYKIGGVRVMCDCLLCSECNT